MILDQSTISEIKERIDIEDVVGDFVSLKKKGQNLWACCPFHNEKSPSFSVAAAKGFYKCFGCGKSGDAIQFVMEVEGASYAEAMKYLAKKYGIEVKEVELSEEDIQEQNERDSLFIILNYAKEHYQKLLWEDEEGKAVGLSYFKERSFSDSILKKFELGYSQKGWNAFGDEAAKNGYSIDIAEKAGLVIRKENKEYDRFRGRVIFPVHNISGKTIAFGARALTKEDQPKYLNSPETEVYHKSKVLYGAFQAKAGMRQKDKCYLVEGYTDVLSLHESGIENVVASSGTSLTEDQIKLISRFTPNVTVLFDGDAAGLKASLRGVDMLLENGLNVRVVVFPDGEDPDSYAKKVGSTAFGEFLDTNEKDFIAFKAGLFAAEAAGDPVKKAETIKDIVRSIAKVPDAIKRTVYIKECANLLDIDEGVLITEQNKILLSERKSANKPRVVEPPIQEALQNKPERTPEIAAVDMIHHQEKESLRLLIKYGGMDLADGFRLDEYLLGELEEVEFHHKDYKEIYELYQAERNAGVDISEQHLIAKSRSHLRGPLIDLISERYELSDKWASKYQIFVHNEKDSLDKAVYANIMRLKLRVVRKLIAENMVQMRDSPSEDETMKFQRIHSKLKESEKEIAKSLGTVVIR